MSPEIPPHNIPLTAADRFHALYFGDRALLSPGKFLAEDRPPGLAFRVS
jgi:hypothetical protein